MSSEVAEILLEFWEVAVHTVLYIYQLYPRDIFEERRYGSMPVFQSRHPDVNGYVKRVLGNAKPLVERGLAESLILGIKDENGKIVQELVFGCILGASKDNGGNANVSASSSSSSKNGKSNGVNNNNQSVGIGLENLKILEEELRSCLLQLMNASSQISMPIEAPENCTWTLMLATKNKEDDVDLAAALLSNEWAIDNNLLPENIARNNAGNAGKAGKANDNMIGIGHASGMSTMPIKSFENAALSLTINAFLFV